MRQALLVSPSPGCGKSKGNGTKRPWTPLKPSLAHKPKGLSRRRWKMFKRRYLTPNPNSASKLKSP